MAPQQRKFREGFSSRGSRNSLCLACERLPHVLAGMVHNFVDKRGFTYCKSVACGIVSVELTAGSNPVKNCVLQSLAADVGNNLCQHLANLPVPMHQQPQSCRYKCRHGAAVRAFALPLLYGSRASASDSARCRFHRFRLHFRAPIFVGALSPIASRMRCSMNQAVFWVTFRPR